MGIYAQFEEKSWPRMPGPCIDQPPLFQEDGGISNSFLGLARPTVASASATSALGVRRSTYNVGTPLRVVQQRSSLVDRLSSPDT